MALPALNTFAGNPLDRAGDQRNSPDWLAEHFAAAFGERYPRGYERALRLRSSLHDVFNREHALSLGRIGELSKREARGYLESLDGTPAYVASRVFLLGLGGHAIPVDQRIADLLAEEAVLSDDVTDADSAASWLERQVRAGEAAHTATILQAWSDDEGAMPKRDRRADAPDFSPPEIPPPVQVEAPEDAEAPKRAAKKKKAAKKSKGLVVLGAPCNDFGGQEAGSEDEILSFCESRFQVTFPMASKVDILGAGLRVDWP
jgi:hypothetical protein